MTQLPLPIAYRYVDVDYAVHPAKLGVRFEPKNQDIADALVRMVPADHRLYHASKRRWILDPQFGPVILHCIEQYCPDAPVQIQSENEDVILSLLFGPSALPDRTVLRPQTVEIQVGGLTIGQWRGKAARSTPRVRK